MPGPGKLKSLGEPSSSRFRGNVSTQRGREAVGDGSSTERFALLRALVRRAPSRKGSVMIYTCCPNCRLRFTAAAAGYLVGCPECGRPPQAMPGAESIVGFRLFVLEDVPQELPEAVAVSLPVPHPGAGGS